MCRGSRATFYAILKMAEKRYNCFKASRVACGKPQNKKFEFHSVGLTLFAPNIITKMKS